MTDEEKVVAVYPHAYILGSKTYGGTLEYICRDAMSGKYLGPTAFSPTNAWKFAAGRLVK